MDYFYDANIIQKITTLQYKVYIFFKKFTRRMKNLGIYYIYIGDSLGWGGIRVSLIAEFG